MLKNLEDLEDAPDQEVEAIAGRNTRPGYGCPHH
jgi:hypothetical protein